MSLRKSIESGKEWRKERKRCGCLSCTLGYRARKLRRANVDDEDVEKETAIRRMKRRV